MEVYSIVYKISYLPCKDSDELIVYSVKKPILRERWIEFATLELIPQNAHLPYDAIESYVITKTDRESALKELRQNRNAEKQNNG